MFASEENLPDKIQHMAACFRLEMADAVLVCCPSVQSAVETGGNYYIPVVALLPLL